MHSLLALSSMSRSLPGLLVCSHCSDQPLDTDNTSAGRDVESTKEKCDDLIKQGYVYRSKKKGSACIGIFESRRKQLAHALFDPTVLITHHVSANTLANSQTADQ